MRLGRHQINDQRWRRPLALPENQRKCLLEVGTTVEIDTDNACSLGLHFRWLDGSPESYILKWLDTRSLQKQARESAYLMTEPRLKNGVGAAGRRL